MSESVYVDLTNGCRTAAELSLIYAHAMPHTLYALLDMYNHSVGALFGLLTARLYRVRDEWIEVKGPVPHFLHSDCQLRVR